MPALVLVAGLSHESNGFVDSVTPMGAFTVHRGAEMLAFHGDGSALGGVLDAGAAMGWTIEPAIVMNAWPSAPAEDAVVQTFLDGVSSSVSRQTAHIDGVMLVMHGAMCTSACSDVEGLVVSALRRIPALRSIPIVAVLDLHGNISTEMASGLDAIVAFRHNPHDDMPESGMRGARILARLMENGVRGRCVRAVPGVLLSPIASATDDLPMRALEGEARAIEAQDPRILEIAIFAGFPYADHADIGMSICVSSIGDPDTAQGHADSLAGVAREHRGSARREDLPPRQLIERMRSFRSGTVVVSEPADNIGGGALGDGTGLLRLLLDVDLGGPSLIAICDPHAVEAMARVAVDDQIRCAIGGRSHRGDEGPVERDWILLHRSDGTFMLEDPASPLAAFHGKLVRMGACVVLGHGQVRVLVTSRPTAPWDLGQWRSQGLSPEQARVIGVKSAAAHRAAYRGIACEFLSVHTPGPCPTDLTSIGYAKYRSPKIP